MQAKYMNKGELEEYLGLIRQAKEDSNKQLYLLCPPIVFFPKYTTKEIKEWSLENRIDLIKIYWDDIKNFLKDFDGAVEYLSTCIKVSENLIEKETELIHDLKDYENE